MSFKLTEDQKEELESILTADGFKVLMQIVIPQIKQSQVERMLKVNDIELANERAKIQGIDIVIRQFKDLKEFLLGNQAKAE